MWTYHHPAWRILFIFFLNFSPYWKLRLRSRKDITSCPSRSWLQAQPGHPEVHCMPADKQPYMLWKKWVKATCQCTPSWLAKQFNSNKFMAKHIKKRCSGSPFSEFILSIYLIRHKAKQSRITRYTKILIFQRAEYHWNCMLAWGL